MNPQTLSISAGVLLAGAAPVLPGEVLFLIACYGAGAIVGQLVAFVLGLRYPGVKEGRVSALLGLFGLVAGLAFLLTGGVG